MIILPRGKHNRKVKITTTRAEKVEDVNTKKDFAKDLCHKPRSELKSKYVVPKLNFDFLWNKNFNDSLFVPSLLFFNSN